VSGNASAMNGDHRPIFAQKLHKGTHIRNIISGVTKLKSAKFLHDVAASLPVLMPLCRWWYCFCFKMPVKRLKAVKCNVW